MKINLKGILEGAWNSIFVKESIEVISTERLVICGFCPHQSEHAKKDGYKSFRPDVHCTLCGCNLEMKTRCLSCECPINKWQAIVSEEEDIKISDKLKQDGENK